MPTYADTTDTDRANRRRHLVAAIRDARTTGAGLDRAAVNNAVGLDADRYATWYRTLIVAGDMANGERVETLAELPDRYTRLARIAADNDADEIADAWQIAADLARRHIDPNRTA